MDIPMHLAYPPMPDSTIGALLERGVILPHPASVFVDGDVDSSRIAPGVVLHPGTRLSGEKLSIGPGCVIGGETPATVVNCALGHDVALKGGFFEDSVFLDESVCGSGAHVRPGCLLEEEACTAHTVGLKQTILFPFVTLGSLINFCDVLMAGGTSRKNHSEVGSSFIHFNFTPNADKATASLLGDVPQGVLLNQPPIFLGGQGGLVGPLSLAFGTVLAAGSVLRESVKEAGRLLRPGGATEDVNRPFHPGSQRRVEEKLRLNLGYLGNLLALDLWYRSFRQAAMSADPWREACRRAALILLRDARTERLRQLEKWAALLDNSSAGAEAAAMARRWPALHEALRLELQAVHEDRALTQLGEKAAESCKSVPDAVRSLRADEQALITNKLNTEVQRTLCLLERVN